MLNKSELISLQKENKRLREKVEEFERIIKLQKSGLKAITGGGTLIVLGSSLVVAIKKYLDVKELHNKVPNGIKAELFAAIIRRVLYIGVFGAIIGILPVAMLFWQNIELREQSKILTNQMVMQQKSELNRIVFGETRQRQEAVKVMLVNERKIPLKRRVDLVGVNMSSVIFPNTDFSKVDFRKSVLVHSTFFGSNFDNSVLDDATAAFTNFEGASFRGASLIKVELTRASFINADLTNANFAGSNLRGANFSGANINGTNFKGACYQDDEEVFTIWPNNFKPKEHGISEKCMFNVVKN